MDGLGISPEDAYTKAEIDIDRPTSFLMCKLMSEDGFLYRHSDGLVLYAANYKAKLFLDEGGYINQKRTSDRKKAASWMVDTFDFLKYPLGIILSILGLYKILLNLNLI
ncbi:MAG: hypothetical protein ACJAR8_000918 [Bacteroidia bacterium]|jgi:hypothetical protein